MAHETTGKRNCSPLASSSNIIAACLPALQDQERRKWASPRSVRDGRQLHRCTCLPRRREPTGNNVAISIASSCPSPSYNRDSLQWIMVKQEDGQWTIQSVSGKRYLGFKNTPKDRTLIFGCEKPQLWDLEILSDSDAYDNVRVKYV